MKTIAILLASLLTIGSQTGFAESIDLSGNCCPVSNEATLNVYQKQQLLLDQLQFESEATNISQVSAVHELVQKKVKSKHEEQASMNSIQLESQTTNISQVTAVHELVQKKVKSKHEEQASMNNIQLETENISLESLHILAQKVNQHVNSETSMTGK